MDADNIMASHSENVIFQSSLCLAGNHNGLASYSYVEVCLEYLITDFGIGE